jgi:3-deoxy-D-manno-octulosonate 8-phosphate phosphatase (KDO 8-P phosphatase)
MGRPVETEVIERLKMIRLLILDVDGVLTDGRIIMDDNGCESKHFNVRDGHGLKVLMRYDVDVVLLTGRTSSVVTHRADDLGIKEVHQGIWNKVEAFEGIIARRGLIPEQVAYVGDDIVDIPLLKRVGFAASVADGCAEARQSVHYVAENGGGRGAVREICELILKAQGKWPDVAARYEFA